MIVDERIEGYIASLGAPADPVLSAMEALAERRRFPIVGRQTGMILSLLARCVGARRVLELGSGYGYSALWFARAMQADGVVTCTDVSTDNRDLALGYFRTAGVENRIQFLVGDALALAREQRPGFDVIFNDIDKQDYPKSVEVAVSLLRPGGLFITDNTLWKGKVTDANSSDPLTAAVQAFNKAVFSRQDLDSVILPVRDGVTVCRRK